MEENIDVCIRVRPLNEREIKAKDAHVLRCVPSMNAISITDRNGTPLSGQTSAFQYDHIFAESVPTSTIYNEVAQRIVLSTLEGINGTIFAYGQTSSGKTHTMHGDHNTELGILPLAVEHIFGYIEQSTDRDFLIRVSYVEIYNEVIRDLLCDDKSLSSLKIREDPKKGIYLESQEVIITDYDDIFRVLDQGDQRRTVGQTIMNERSSRSHSIFRIVIESKKKSPPTTGRGSVEELQGGVLVGVLNLVDLAGSESVRHTASEGMRLREASNINRSLLTLSRVINSLAQGAGSIQNAPFRDSKLTRLLQRQETRVCLSLTSFFCSSLAGSTRTLMICCVTPSDRHLEETKSTLQFAARAKNIQLSAGVNEVLDDQVQLQRLKREVFDLRQQVDNNAEMHALKAENMALAEVKSKHEAKIERLMSLIVSSTKAPTDSKPKAKRTRETWGPGDVLNSLQQHSSNLEQVILHELQASSNPVAKKQRKERHSDGQTVDDQVTTHLKIQLEAKERMIRQLQDQPCGSCSNHAGHVKELETLLQEVANDRASLQVELEETTNQLHDSQSNEEAMIHKMRAFDEVLEEIEASRNEAIEQVLLLETQHGQVQAHLADQVEKCQETENALMSLQEKCDRYEKALEAQTSAAGDESSHSAHLAESYEAKLDAQSAQHAHDVDLWKAKYADLERQLSMAREEVTSIQMNTSTLHAENLRLNEECAAQQDALAASTAMAKTLEEGAQDQASALVHLMQASRDEAERQVEDLRKEKDDELTALKTANQALSAEFEQATVKFEAELQSLKQELDEVASQNRVLQQGKAESMAENEQLQQTIAEQAQRLDELIQHQISSGQGASAQVEDMERQLVWHREESSRLESVVRDLAQAKAQLETELEIAAAAAASQLNEAAGQVQAKFDELSAHYKEKESAAQDTIDKLNNVIFGLNGQVASLSEEAMNLQSEKAQLLQDADALSSQAESMYMATQAMEHEEFLAEREATYQALKADMDVLMRTHVKEGEVLRKQMEDLQDQVVNVNIELLQKQQTIELLIVEKEASQSEASTGIKTELAALEERLATLNDLNTALRAESSKHAEAVAVLEGALANVNGEVSMLKAALEAQTSMHQGKLVELEELQRAHSALKLSVTTMQEKEGGLLASLESTTQQCAAMEAKCSSLLEDLAEKDNQLAQLRDEAQAQGQADLERALQEQASTYNEEVQRASLVNDKLRTEIDELNATWQEKWAGTLASRDAEVNALAAAKQALELKIQDMEQNSTQSAAADDEMRSLNAQLVTMKNELDAQLEEKEALYDKIDDLEKAAISSSQRQSEHVEMLQRQWEMEKATLTDRLDVQRDRINKLDLVKMTKGHLEVFEKLKLNIKKKTEEVATLQRQLLESKNDEMVELMEERWKCEQKERKLVETKLDELKLKLNTTQNEFQIKNSEVASLQHAINQYEGHIDTLESQIRHHGNSSAEIKELRQHVAHLEDQLQNQRQQFLMQEEEIQSQAQLREVHAAQLTELHALLNDKDVRLKQCEEAVVSKEKEWQDTSDDLHEKFQADLRYLEKENLELHLELKQTKRLLSSKGISPPPPANARVGLQELHENQPSSLTKSLLGPPAKRASLLPDKENTPAAQVAESPEECKQQ